MAMLLKAEDGAMLKLDGGATLAEGATLDGKARLDDGAADWETMFVGLTGITEFDGATLTTGVEVDIIGVNVGVGGLKTFPV